jgi:hypothetical protein
MTVPGRPVAGRGGAARITLAGMRRCSHARRGSEPPVTSTDAPTGALPDGCEVGGHRARSQRSREALDAAAAVATRRMLDSVQVAARASGSGRT